MTAWELQGVGMTWIPPDIQKSLVCMLSSTRVRSFFDPGPGTVGGMEIGCQLVHHVHQSMRTGYLAETCVQAMPHAKVLGHDYAYIEEIATQRFVKVAGLEDQKAYVVVSFKDTIHIPGFLDRI